MLKSTRRFFSQVPPVLFQEFQNSRLVTLNREKALNSLNIEMIESMLPMYRSWDKHEPKNSIAIVLKGEGQKAFCAGGDVVAIYKDHPKGTQKRFFYREYQLNYAIMTLPHPHIALWDGIVMGGGVGVSVHGSHRVATEHALFAMPETGLGLFPDVGGTWFLPRLPHEGLGMYLALTGQRLKGSDLIHAGIGTHFVPREKLHHCETALCHIEHASKVNEVLQDFAVPHPELPPFSLQGHLKDIQQHFGWHQKTVEEIVSSLTSAKTEWCEKTAKTLSKMSPSSMKISCALNHMGSKMTDPEDMFRTEYFTSQQCMRTKDFFAGVKALLIDKTGKPEWEPKTLEEVSLEAVDAHFKAGEPESIVWHPMDPLPNAKL